ncbi:MAG: hypothetical protein F4207_15300 [Gemmatimonadetes bacterium]|nr:hypothetical protein [Gemmatimonadota bacterium]MYG17769.1 hypothetical protein [Gemmatimonadota bacterium]
MWKNPVTFAVLLGATGSLVSIGIWICRINSFKASVESTLAEIKESINSIQSGFHGEDPAPTSAGLKRIDTCYVNRKQLASRG